MWAFHAKLWDWRGLEANTGISPLDSAQINSKKKKKVHSWGKRKKTNKHKIRLSKKHSTSPGLSHSKHWNNRVISYEKMQLLLQVQVHQIQERESSLTPWRSIRTCACVLTQSCLTLCNPVDCSPKGCSVHGVFQARILEWVATPFSKRSSWLRDWTCISFVSWQADSLPPWHPGSP